MSNEINTSENNDANNSCPPTPSLVDLDEISASASNNATVTATPIDEKHDNHNNNTTNFPASPDIISNVGSTEGQQSGVSIDDNSLATTILSPHQNGNYSDMEREDMTFTKDDSNSDAQPTNTDLETSDDGSSHFDKLDVDENETDTNYTDGNNAPALDESTTSNIGNGTLGQDPIDTTKKQQSDPGDFGSDGSENNNGFDGFGQSGEDNDDFAFNKNNSECDDDFDDFGQANGEDYDDFGDFGDFDQAGELGADDNDDDFGDFGDLPEPGFTKDTVPHEDLPLDSVVSTPSDPTLADQYIQVLQTDQSSLSPFIENTLSHLWTPISESKDTLVASPAFINGTHTSSPQRNDYDFDELLCTQCSLDLWQKVSRDSVFYNPVTGSIGQFQWTRSEVNRAYLNALGVCINYEDRLQDSRPTSMTSSPSLQHRHYSQGHQPSTTYGSSTNASASSSPSMSRTNDRSTNHMRSSSLSDGISLTGAATVAALHGGVIPGPSKPPIEEEPELDIDIAKAYCELTEETIRVFPDVKLNAMVVELSRLQRQAKEYLGYLLDQREQLMMDAETYNDLISCIVGHAQRLREQNVAKDASPAMVSKKKKTTGLSGMIKRKNTTGGGTGGTSMGGGVVGVKQSSTSAASKSTNAGEGRRSL